MIPIVKIVCPGRRCVRGSGVHDFLLMIEQVSAWGDEGRCDGAEQ